MIVKEPLQSKFALKLHKTKRADRAGRQHSKKRRENALGYRCVPYTRIGVSDGQKSGIRMFRRSKHTI